MRWGLAVWICVPLNASAQVLRVWPHAAPGSEQWTQRESSERIDDHGVVAFKVVTPTLTAFLPARERATGAAVIIAPGGAFRGVTIEQEGAGVATWFIQHGIATFVLKYRVLDYHAPGNASLSIDSAGRFAIADGIQALRVVRRHAAEWGIDRDRIGYLGFSAGGMVASSVLLQPDPRDRPAFVLLVYGAPFGDMPAIPHALPPTFLIWSRDDAVAAGAMTRFSAALRAAGERADEHVFEHGGHGFALRRQGTDSDRWITLAYQWLNTRHMLAPRTP